MEIGYKFFSSDHKPLIFSLNLKTNESSENNTDTSVVISVINWSNIPYMQEYMHFYHDYSNQLLEEINLPKGALICHQSNYKNDSHKSLLTIFYKNIVVVLTEASDKHLVKPSNGYDRKKYSIPGWNYHLIDCHAAARDAFLHWRQYCSLRSRTLAYLMQKSCSLFKYLFP